MKRPDASSVIAIVCIVLIAVMSAGLGYMLHDRIKPADAADFSAVTEMAGVIKKHFYFYDAEKNDEALVRDALRGMVGGLDDPYAGYYTREEYDELLAEDAGEYRGLGISVAVPDERGSEILSVYAGSPAANAGIYKGDVITDINGVHVPGLSMDDFVAAFSADDAVPDEITLLRDGRTILVSVLRDVVHVARVSFEQLDDGVGYIRISEFHGTVAHEFWSAVQSLQASGMTRLVLDLRDNPGGGLTEVLGVANRLVPKGELIATIRSKTDDAEVYYSTGDERLTDVPIAVLVNGGSASASELLSGALQDNGIAKIVGTQTYGKGIVQTYFRLSGSGGWVKLTTEAYYTPNDVCIHGVGITPDLTVELPETLRSVAVEELAHGEDTQLQAAIVLLKNPSQEAA